MAVLERELQQLEDFNEARPSSEPRATRRARGRTPLDLDGRISTRWTVTLALMWAGLLSTWLLVTPPPTNPDAVPDLLSALLFLVALAPFFATMASLFERRRSAFASSVWASGVLLVVTVACPLTGHHAFALWWGAQLAAALGLVGISALGLTRS